MAKNKKSAKKSNQQKHIKILAISQILTIVVFAIISVITYDYVRILRSDNEILGVSNVTRLIRDGVNRTTQPAPAADIQLIPEMGITFQRQSFNEQIEYSYQAADEDGPAHATVTSSALKLLAEDELNKISNINIFDDAQYAKGIERTQTCARPYIIATDSGLNYDGYSQMMSVPLADGSELNVFKTDQALCQGAENKLQALETALSTATKTN